MLAPINDDAALAKALRSVIDDRALREKIVAQGYEDYHARYTREAVTRQWIEYYQNLLKTRAA
jgi:glycosyltransferase involved in cell wall biosynthesis